MWHSRPRLCSSAARSALAAEAANTAEGGCATSTDCDHGCASRRPARRKSETPAAAPALPPVAILLPHPERRAYDIDMLMRTPLLLSSIVTVLVIGLAVACVFAADANAPATQPSQ